MTTERKQMTERATMDERAAVPEDLYKAYARALAVLGWVGMDSWERECTAEDLKYIHEVADKYGIVVEGAYEND